MFCLGFAMILIVIFIRYSIKSSTKILLDKPTNDPKS